MSEGSSSRPAGPAAGRIVIKTLGGLAGPLSAFIAAVGEEVWNRLVEDLEGRQFSRGEKARLEKALPSAVNEAARRIDQGETLEEDFRETASSGRTNAEQVLETGILAAAETHDDRKAEYLGNLVGGVGFYGKAGFGPIRSADALVLIELARELTYRQYILLALVVEGANRDDRYVDGMMVLGPLLMEVDGLYRQGLAAQGSDMPLHPLQVKWTQLAPTDNGVALYNLMVLSSLDAAHKQQVRDAVDLAHRTA